MDGTPWRVKKRICPMFIICKAKTCEFSRPSTVLMKDCWCDGADRGEGHQGADPTKMDLVEIDDE